MIRSTDAFSRSRHGTWFSDVLILAAVQLAIGLPWLNTVPRLYTDDVWEASLGHSLACDGVLRHGIIEGWGGIHVHFIQNQMIQPLVLAAGYKLFGFSMLLSRLISVLAGVAALVAVYLVTRTLAERRVALLAGLLTAIHPWFFEIARRVRPDIFVVALAFWAFWFWLQALRFEKGSSAFGAGFLAAMAGLAHPTGFVLSAALLVSVLVWERPARLKSLMAWGMTGGIVGVLPYAAYVAWAVRDPGVDFFQQMRGAKPLMILDAGGLIGAELFRWKHFFQWPIGAPLAALLALGWMAAWIRSERADKLMATCIVLFATALPFTTVNTTSRYLVGLVPLFSALLVRMVQRVINQPAGTVRMQWRLRCGLGVVGVYAVICLGAVGMMFHRLHDADFTRVLDRVVEVTGPGAHVVGEQLFWLERNRYRFGPLPIHHPWSVDNTEPSVQTICRYRPDFAIRSAWSFNSSYGVSRPPASMPAWRESTIDEVCRRFGSQVASFRDPHFGPVEIYRLNWAVQPATVEAMSD